jgi:hypothetical protein
MSNYCPHSEGAPCAECVGGRHHPPMGERVMELTTFLIPCEEHPDAGHDTMCTGCRRQLIDGHGAWRERHGATTERARIAAWLWGESRKHTRERRDVLEDAAEAVESGGHGE